MWRRGAWAPEVGKQGDRVEASGQCCCLLTWCKQGKEVALCREVTEEPAHRRSCPFVYLLSKERVS